MPTGLVFVLDTAAGREVSPATLTLRGHCPRDSNGCMTPIFLHDGNPPSPQITPCGGLYPFSCTCSHLLKQVLARRDTYLWSPVLIYLSRPYLSGSLSDLYQIFISLLPQYLLNWLYVLIAFLMSPFRTVFLFSS